MPEAFIVAARTPTGRTLEGPLASIRPDDMGVLHLDGIGLGQVVQERVEGGGRHVGAAIGASGQGHNLGWAVVLAGLPDSVPGAIVNRMWASIVERRGGRWR